jgi:hypothetical protein
VPSLRELQESFADAVLYERTERVCQSIAHRGLAPERRLAIYRNNAREGFLKTLAATFPVLQKLAGEAWLRQTGRAYMRAHPSRSGNLHYVGERFATFLQTQLADTEFDYFTDVARLEWAYQEVLIAADHPGFDIATLASASPQQYDALRFTVHPAARLVASPYPVLAIWKANQIESEGSGAIRLDAGPSRVLLIRREDHVELRELDASEFALLNAFAEGLCFANAAAAALAAQPACDLTVAFARIVRLGAFVDFSLETAAFQAPTEAHAFSD